MKKINKKISLFMMLSLLYIIIPIDALAKDYRFSHNRVNSCVNDGSCILMCGYTNEIYMTAASKDDWTVYSSYIYYSNKENKFFVESHRSDQARTTYDWSSNSVFKSSYAKEKLKKGECPLNSYIENDGLTSEICFDNNSTENGYCVANDPGGIGTKFRGTSILEYDNMAQIDTWLNNWSYGNINCLDMVGKTTDEMEDFISDKFTSDWNNYLHEKKIDSFSFILQLVNSKKEKIAGEKKDEFVLKCTEEIKSDETLTDEEKEETIKDLEDIDGDDIADEWVDDLEEPDDEYNEDDEEDLGAISGCEDLGETGELIRQIYNLLKYLIPILIVGLSIVDFLKVILNGEEKVFNEAWSKFIKRIIVGIVILILPMILSFVIGVSGVLENYGIDANNSNDIFCIFR